MILSVLHNIADDKHNCCGHLVCAINSECVADIIETYKLKPKNKKIYIPFK
jgi:hypothetical protein